MMDLKFPGNGIEKRWAENVRQAAVYARTPDLLDLVAGNLS